MDLYDEIYYSLIGELEPGLNWVPDAFAPGSECDQAYARLLAARNRILARLHQDDDPDLSRMLTEMDIIQRSLCRKLLALKQP